MQLTDPSKPKLSGLLEDKLRGCGHLGFKYLGGFFRWAELGMG
jgi:hypothetical protein